MNLQKIELLIEKYEKGQTSRKDEVELRSFFEKDDVPFHLAGYKDLFTFYKKAGDEMIPDADFDDRVMASIAGLKPALEASKPKVRWMNPFVGIAAGIVLIIGLYFIFQQQNETRDTFEDPEIAYLETRKILLQVSGNLNSGVEELSNMKEMNNGLENLNSIKTFDEGMKKIRKISILDKSKDIITQKTYKQ